MVKPHIIDNPAEIRRFLDKYRMAASATIVGQATRKELGQRAGTYVVIRRGVGDKDWVDVYVGDDLDLAVGIYNDLG
jgi:hypothetical protein